MVQDYAESKHSCSPSRGLVFSCLDPLKPCQNQAACGRMETSRGCQNDTDLTTVSSHRRKLQSSHAGCPETGLGHFRQYRDGMAAAHELGHLGETGGAESKVGSQLRLFAILSKAFVELASGRNCNGPLRQYRRGVLLLLRPRRRREQRITNLTDRVTTTADLRRIPKSILCSFSPLLWPLCACSEKKSAWVVLRR